MWVPVVGGRRWFCCRAVEPRHHRLLCPHPGACSNLRTPPFVQETGAPWKQKSRVSLTWWLCLLPSVSLPTAGTSVFTAAKV